MSIEILRQIALDAAAALDAQPDVQRWPEQMNALVARLQGIAAQAGIDAEAFADALELPCEAHDAVAFEPTRPPDLTGLSTASVAELHAWAQAPGAGRLLGEYGCVPCLPGEIWSTDAFDDGTADAADHPGAPHMVVGTLLADDCLEDADAGPIDDRTPGDWGPVRPAGDARWLILSEECGEQAIIAAPHLATSACPLPLFRVDWMDEIGLIYLGGSARDGLRSLHRRGIEAVVSQTASLMGASRRVFRGLLFG